MNSAHLHLMFNHLPVVGVPLLAALLAWALLRRSRELYRVVLGAVVVLAALTYPVFLTGEPAEESVEDAGWVREQLIHQHEERAEAALTAVLVTGAIAAFGLWQTRGNRTPGFTVGGVTLAGLALSAVLLGWTAYLGGPIRHDEIRTEASAATPATPAPRDRDD
ncbi:MAG TPA: hypothetical protein VG692_10485 [Gemmatimonadales bacterium]|nr:hypothetical protein [Gemmatimonadales bacterium]